MLTRWGTWISAATYYAEHLLDIARVLEQLDEEDAASIRHANGLIQNENLKRQLAFINTNYSFLPLTIAQLEEQGLCIENSLKLLEDAEARISSVGGDSGAAIFEKFKFVFGKNTGLKTMRGISKVLQGEDLTSEEESLFAGFEPMDYAVFKYATITSCDVERSFSRFRSLLRTNRERMTVEHLCWLLVCHCNAT